MASVLPTPQLAFSLPDADLSSLMGLSDASEVREWTEGKISEYKKHILTLTAIHNSISPINKLPTEILQNVFELVPDRRCTVFWMLSLQSVCHRWRSVLLATPEYWVQGINEGMCLQVWEGDPDSRSYFCDLFLARSKPCPLELNMGTRSSKMWEVLEGHFDRVTSVSVRATDEENLLDIIWIMRKNMKSLQRLTLKVYRFRIRQCWLSWESDEFPHLEYLEIDSALFSSTAVPSLRTVILTGERKISLPDLLEGLEACPSIETLRLRITSDQELDDKRTQTWTPDHLVDLPNLRRLDVTGPTSDVYTFLSCISFPSTTRVVLNIDNVTGTGQRLVPANALLHRSSGLYTSPTIDRLLLVGSDLRSTGQATMFSMEGRIQGVTRLDVRPASWILDINYLVQFLDAFRARMVAELAVSFHHVVSGLDGEFWGRLFAALPDLRRLELLSPSVESRAGKRVVAAHFLASLRAPERARRGSVSIAWVLRGGRDSTSQLEAELEDIEHVLSEHVRAEGARLERLELYVTTPQPETENFATVNIPEGMTDGPARQLVARRHVARLGDAASVVVIGGGWDSEEDKGDTGCSKSEDVCMDMTDEEEEE
ncbi:hypothetical protein GSI_04575 [Ganoderma sinense ZZ0214-1]|uniref:F-box domain-containing protein n=1 Tax=Ganoderma sinense ZZ0214-1 TaxID=1077348 RepID=A0A2G8SH87_9APHY|nr:hypothetical protein GSI_04575 [Ganoderma sinense ZZ0214-1]